MWVFVGGPLGLHATEEAGAGLLLLRLEAPVHPRASVPAPSRLMAGGPARGAGLWHRDPLFLGTLCAASSALRASFENLLA